MLIQIQNNDYTLLIINNIENISVPVHNFHGSGKYKKDVLLHHECACDYLCLKRNKQQKY